MKNPLRFVVPVLLLVLASLPAVAADAAKSAESSPQAKAYEALQKAIAAGDYQGVRNSMSKATLEKIDKQNKEMGLDPKKMMEMMKALAPTDLTFTGLKVEGKQATLDATAKLGGEANWG